MRGAFNPKLGESNMSTYATPEITANFAALGFTPVDPTTVMKDWWPEAPAPDDEVPATFYHAGIDTYAAYAPSIIDGMWDDKLKELPAIAVVDFDAENEFMMFPDIPLEVIEVKDLADFVAQRTFNPIYFDLRIAKRCVAHAQQELSDLDGDERPTREQFRQARNTLKEALKHLRNLVVPRFHSITRSLLPKLSLRTQPTCHGLPF
jgi:hypothetical protein